MKRRATPPKPNVEVEALASLALACDQIRILRERFSADHRETAVTLLKQALEDFDAGDNKPR